LAYSCGRQQVEKKTVLENLDLVLLCMDEIVDGGWVSVADCRFARVGGCEAIDVRISTDGT
jgi:hypothetical protein